jgi:hypothetical protein
MPWRYCAEMAVIGQGAIRSSDLKPLATTLAATNQKGTKMNEAITKHINKHGSVYMSVTGLKAKGLLAKLSFWRHAIPSLTQAKSAQGLLFLEVKPLDGYHHTLTVWENRQAMVTYIRTGAHAKAMKNFNKFATGKIVGVEVTNAPTWVEALKIWAEQGRAV